MREVVDGLAELNLALAEFCIVSLRLLELLDDFCLPLAEIVGFCDIQIVLLQPLIENSLLTLSVVRLSDCDRNDGEEYAN